ncbi:MAG: ATP-binding cassette domain-containing protein [Myxococcales bacterium]|nr:ATP-binding cassette domain-containing protein [Myxococcales bacterium]
MSGPAPALLEARALDVGYGGRALLPTLDLRIDAGQTWAVLGRNGGGKSTLLRTLVGSQRPVRGAVHRYGTALSYVPQRHSTDAFLPARVIDVVTAGRDSGWSFLVPGALRDLVHLIAARRHQPQGGCGGDAPSGREAVDEHDAVAEAIAETALDSVRYRRFSELSEGQKQRALIARALVSSPRLIVLDEPTSAMDIVSEDAIFELLEHLRRDHHMTLLVATHQLHFLDRFATHALLVDKDTRTLEAGVASELSSSAAFARHYGRSGRPPANAHGATP